VEQDSFLVPTFGTFLGALSAQYPGGVNLPAPGADVTAQQAIAYTGTSESIVPNGSFLLGNTQDWFVCEGSGSFNWDATNKVMIIPAGGGVGVGSQSFAVVPSRKYRIVFDVWAGSGSQDTYLRINYSGSYQAQITGANRSGATDFISAGSIATSETIYSYDWTCPAGVFFASVSVYNWTGTAVNIAVRSVSATPYSGVGQWGADVTGSNTSADTNHVSGVPSSTIAQVVPNGYKLFINSGSRSYSIQAI
jgi:hypothetical protein